MRHQHIQIFKKSLLALLLILLLSNFKCSKEFDYGTQFEVKFKNFRAAWLDNRDSLPRIVAAGDTVLRSAFGFQIAAVLCDSAGKSLPLSLGEFYLLNAAPAVKKISVEAVEGFDGVAAGADISSRFRGRVADFSSVEYVSMDEMRRRFNNFNLDGSASPPSSIFTTHLLMVEPPSESRAFRCAVRVEFEGSDLVSRDTFFDLPFIFLK